MVSMDTKHSPKNDNPGDCHCVFTSHTRVNLAILVYTCGFMVGGTIQSQYVYDWVKRHLHFQNDVTTNATVNSSETLMCGLKKSSENYYQKISSEWLWYFNLVELGIAFPVIFYWGVRSDFIGRKPLMVVSSIGFIIKYVLMTIFIYFDFHLRYFYACFVISGLVGHYYTFFLACMSSVADTTSPSQARSMGLAITNIALSVGSTLALTGTGYLIQYTFYFYPSLLTTGLGVVTLLVVITLVSETRAVEKSLKRPTLLKSLDHYTSFYRNKQTLKNQPLWLFYCLVFALIFLHSTSSTRNSIETLYALRSPFCWDAVKLGWFRTIRDTVLLIIGLSLVKPLQMCFTDEVITIIGGISSISYYVLEAISSTDWFIYVASATGLLCMVPQTLVRAAMSSLVQADKQGSLFANTYMVEALSTIAGTTLFNNIYANTQNTMRGLVFMVMAGFTFLALFLIIISTILKPKPTYTSVDQVQAET